MPFSASSHIFTFTFSTSAMSYYFHCVLSEAHAQVQDFEDPLSNERAPRVLWIKNVSRLRSQVRGLYNTCKFILTDEGIEFFLIESSIHDNQFGVTPFPSVRPDTGYKCVPSWTGLLVPILFALSTSTDSYANGLN